MNFRVNHGEIPYFQVSRKTAQDENLSFEALGLLTYLLSKPDDWRCTIGDLRKRGNIGRDKAYILVAELLKARYMRRSQPRDDHGRMSKTIIDVYESPYTEKPEAVTAIPLSENPHADSQEAARARKSKRVKPLQAKKAPLHIIESTYSRESEDILMSKPIKISSAREDKSLDSQTDTSTQPVTTNTPLPPAAPVTTPQPPTTDHQKGMAYLVERCGRFPNMAAQGRALKQILASKYTLDQAIACLEDQLTTWTKGTVSWISVSNHITDFVRRNQPKQETTRNEPTKPRTVADIFRARQARANGNGNTHHPATEPNEPIPDALARSH